MEKTSSASAFEDVFEELKQLIHDVRNPLAAIRARAQLGTLTAKEYPKCVDMFEDIIANVDRVNEQLQRLADVNDRLGQLESKKP